MFGTTIQTGIYKKYKMKSILLSLYVLSLSLVANAMFAPNGTTSSPSSNSVRMMMMESASARPEIVRAPKEIYFDLTKQIDSALNGDSEEFSKVVEKINQKKTKAGKGAHPVPGIVYYTDGLLSDLEQLAPVAKLLDKNLENARLYLKFNATEENTIADIFHPVPSILPEEARKSLEKHVSGILIDLESKRCSSSHYWDDYQSSEGEYDKRWGISYLNLAKRMVKNMFGPETSIKVGAVFKASQMKYCYNVLEQLKDAEFLVMGLEYVTEYQFPLSYNVFKQHLRIQAMNTLNALRSAGIGNDTELVFKLSLSQYDPKNVYLYYSNTEEETAKDDIINRARFAYPRILKRYAKQWAMESEGGSIILENHVDFDKEMEMNEDGEVIPQLYVQEMDVTPCQMRTLLGQVAESSSSLVVNEYTWNAFARFHSRQEMLPNTCPKSTAWPENPPETFLFFTSGIGNMWNKTEEYFTELLTQHQTMLGWNISTLVFSGKDVLRAGEKASNCIYSCPRESTLSKDVGILKFATDMKEAEYKIGCLVELEDQMRDTYNSVWKIDSYTKLHCGSKDLWNISDVIVLKFDLKFERDITYDFSFKSDSYTLKRSLLNLLIAREKFQKENPDKELIIQVNLWNVLSTINRWKDIMHFDYYDDNGMYQVVSFNNTERPQCNLAVLELNSFYESVLTWAKIHGVRVVVEQVYNRDYPTAGTLELPEEDGTPKGREKGECKRVEEFWIIRMALNY